jgi:hypothetical protein
MHAHRLRAPQTSLINLSDLTKRERIQVDAVYEAADDPAVILERKIEHLAELLDCTEAEATRILLSKL